MFKNLVFTIGCCKFANAKFIIVNRYYGHYFTLKAVFRSVWHF